MRQEQIREGRVERICSHRQFQIDSEGTPVHIICSYLFVLLLTHVLEVRGARAGVREYPVSFTSLKDIVYYPSSPPGSVIRPSRRVLS